MEPRLRCSDLTSQEALDDFELEFCLVLLHGTPWSLSNSWGPVHSMHLLQPNTFNGSQTPYKGEVNVPHEYGKSHVKVFARLAPNP